jgi:hypothetical protein
VNHLRADVGSSPPTNGSKKVRFGTNIVFTIGCGIHLVRFLQGGTVARFLLA